MATLFVIANRYSALCADKVRVGSLEEAVDLVRQKWPLAAMEGSTGFERSFASKTSIGLRLVAHCWSPTNDASWYWVRVAPDLDHTLDESNPVATSSPAYRKSHSGPDSGF